MKRHSWLATTALLLSTTVLLTACGGKKAETPAPAAEATPAAPAGPVTIDFWYSVGGKNGELVKNLSQRFNDSQKEVIVNPVYQGDYYATNQKLSTAIASNSVPAMTMLEAGFISFFNENKALLDLSAFAEKDKAMVDDFLPGLMLEARQNGKLVAIPFNRSTPILYINTNQLKAAGLDPAGPKNWQELRDYAKKLTVYKDGKIERWGFLTPIDDWFFQALFYQAGGKFFNDNKTKVQFNGPEGQAAVQLWYDLIHTDKSMEMPQGEGYNAWDVSTNAFTSGKAAMIYSTTGRLVSHVNGAKDFTVATAFMPAGAKGFATPTGGANVAILAKAPKDQQAAAWKFIKWLSQPEIVAEWSKATGYVAVTKSGVASMADYYKTLPQAKVAVDQLQYAQSQPQHPAWTEIKAALTKGLQKAVLKELSVKDALDQAAAEAEKAMK
ncbi:MAG TPA: ABC transporter substrate-binding protein [Symbiobacteriaceae bacterium]|nr:ABC transporter substrate-binding protein [Symbiobacteriaceae bacterium]